MLKDKKLVALLVVVAFGLLVVGNIAYGAYNSRNAIQGWPDVDMGASEVLEYKDTPERPLHLHVFAAEVIPAPTVLLFHGGGLARTRVEQFTPQAERLNAEGYTVVLAEYRVRPEGVATADIIDDAQDALAWLRANGQNHGVDTSFVAAGGASAGGWLAAEAAKTNTPPDALVLFNPAVNSADASTNLVPTVVFHSTEDQVIAIGRVEEFCEASVECTLHMWFTGDHGYFNQDVDEDAFEDTTAKMIEHLNSVS